MGSAFPHPLSLMPKPLTLTLNPLQNWASQINCLVMWAVSCGEEDMLVESIALGKHPNPLIVLFFIILVMSSWSGFALTLPLLLQCRQIQRRNPKFVCQQLHVRLQRTKLRRQPVPRLRRALR